MKRNFIIILLSQLLLFTILSCASSPKGSDKENQESKKSEKITQTEDVENKTSATTENKTSATTEKKSSDTLIHDLKSPKVSLNLLFAGDIMAHEENYKITTFTKIWRDVKNLIEEPDITFANIEAPVDPTKPASSYPNFNMKKEYLQAAVDAGFDVFSLCNNHTNDQLLGGIKETLKTAAEITGEEEAKGKPVYFSGLKEIPEASFSYNFIEQNGWKILFLPVTELLNRPDCQSYINFVKPEDDIREDFIKYVKKLRQENPCDLFVLSLHTSEPEYTRVVTERQEKFYRDLLEAGVDILWANHAHIIKDRQIIINTRGGNDKIIMYANGNTISGQRRKPDFNAKNPDFERDNTGDGLLYSVTVTKKEKCVKIKKIEPIFITTYINTAWEFVIKPMNQEFIDYLYDVPRLNWAKYIERRIKINKKETKDLIEWQ